MFSPESSAQAYKGQNTRLHAIPLKSNRADAKNDLPVIGFVSAVPYEAAGPEIRQAYDQVTSKSSFTCEYLTINDFCKQSRKTGRFSAVWIHRADTAGFTSQEIDRKFIHTVKTYVEEGGKLLLTLQAVHYLNAAGFEPRMLRDSTKPCIDEGYGRRLGVHAFRTHPIFTGLNGGAYLCRPPRNVTARITGFFGDQAPQNGKVVAVDWDYIFLREQSKLVLEYTHGKGTILAVGGYMNYTMANDNAAHLSMFTENCLNYLLGRFGGSPAYYWNYATAEVTECPAGPESDRLLKAVPPAVAWDTQTSDLSLKRRFASENFWDVAGERLLTMGTENGGIEEMWAHPFMAFRDYEVGIRFSYRDTIVWLNDERPEISVNPAFFERQYKFSRAYLRELIVNDPAEPNGVIHYEYRGVYPARLVIRFKSNMRWMWPYSEKVTGSLCHAWDPDFGAITIRDQSGDLNLYIGANRTPVNHVAGRFDGFNYSREDSTFQPLPTEKVQVAGLLEYDLAANDNLDVVFSASVEGSAETRNQFERTITEPGSVYRRANQHTDGLLSKSLMITTPDPDFNAGYRWAILATDRFFVHTPGMGKALVAGYSTTRHGWDGGHKVNGRPGYGWYFGRDAEWSSFALLDYGDFDKVKAQLEFFNKFQDLNGKILHEASTSGLIHYDAADATPLYLVLAGRYFRHTNDTAFIRKTWPNIKRAINFCFSTDTDLDHLIENTNVGHGWVEGGELYGSHATIYMAGSWGAALKEASNMAVFMKDIEAESFRLASEEQQNIINNDFWDDEKRFFAYGKNKDGSFRRDQTILPTVPICFGMADRDKAAIAMKFIAGNAFTTNWGARILREDNPLFKPTGYHYGSVWPLFTGWASLAEYNTGLSNQGFSHMMNNLVVYRNWGLGFAEEVLNGSEYTPSGVCAHQCWSETMVLQPAIEGMLGLNVKAQERRIILAPQFPPQWDSLKASHIRIGEQLIDFDFLRDSTGSAYTFELDKGNPVKIDFMPVFPAGTKFTRVTLDGREVPFTTFKTAGSMTLITSLTLNERLKLLIETESGISVLPLVQDPKPGSSAEGMRILGTRLSGNKYEVEVEGLSGSSEMISIWFDDVRPPEVQNARVVDRSGKITRLMVDFGKGTTKYATRTVLVNYNP